MIAFKSDVYSTCLSGRITEIFITNEYEYEKKRCHFQIKHGTKIIFHHVQYYLVRRNFFEQCQMCHQCIPDEYMDIHLDPAVHFGHELVLTYFKFKEEFFEYSSRLVIIENEPAEFFLESIGISNKRITYRYCTRDYSKRGIASSADIQFENVRRDEDTPLEIFENDFFKPVFERFEDLLNGKQTYKILYRKNISKPI